MEAPNAMIEHRRKRLELKDWPVAVGLAFVLVGGLWLLWPGITGPFLFDDYPNLQNLREVGDHFTRESIGRYLAAWQGNPGRPLAALSFLIEDHAWPSDPEAFKRNNLFWHLLVGLGIFALTRRLVRLALANRAAPVGAGHARDPDVAAGEKSSIPEESGSAHGQPPRVARLRPQAVSRDAETPDTAAAPTQLETTTHAADWIALAVLALWLVHPFQLSATFLVVQRMTILANGLMVAGLLIYLRLVGGGSPGLTLRFKPGYQSGHAAPGWREAIAALAALGGFGGLAFLAKENGPLIFAYATALNLTLLAPALARFDTGPRRLIWAGTLGMTLLLIAALLWQVRDPAAAYAGRDFSLAERVLSQARILWEYLHTIVLPKLGGGGIYHDDFVVSHGLLQPWTTLPAVLGIVAAFGLALIGRHRFPLVAFAVLWFAAGHLIESTVIPLEIYFEHRNYLAMVGPLLALCVWLAYPGGDLKWPLRILLVVWIALVAGIGHLAARQWSDGLTLAAVWERERPQSARAAQFLASEFVRQDDYIAARNVLLNARDRLPSAGEFTFQLALLDCRYGQANDDTFESLIAHAGRSNWSRIVPEIVISLRGYMDNDRCGKALPPERFLRLIQALLKNPEYAGRPDAVAHLHYELARMYLDTDQPQAALAHFEASYVARPDPQVAINLAQVALYLGDADEASRWISVVEATPRPWFKSWLDPKTAKIDQLRNTTEAVRAVEGRPQ
jgi:tetratricopeptide (TPR) repeat protein